MASDITPEAIGFLSAVGVFIVALAVLFLFINKKLCFSRVGGLPCLEQHGRRKKGRQGVRQGLGSESVDQADDERMQNGQIGNNLETTVQSLEGKSHSKVDQS